MEWDKKDSRRHKYMICQYGGKCCLEKYNDLNKNITQKIGTAKGISKRENDRDIVELENEKIVFVKISPEMHYSPTFGDYFRHIYIYLVGTLQEGDKTLTVLGTNPEELKNKRIKMLLAFQSKLPESVDILLSPLNPLTLKKGQFGRQQD